MTDREPALPVGARADSVIDLAEGKSPWHALRGKLVGDAVLWGHFPAYAVVRRADIT